MTKTVAVFSICFNESVWLPIWVRHYLNQGFDPTDIYILDNMSGDGSTINLQGCHRMLVDHPTNWDHIWLNRTVEHFQQKLLEKYDYVVFAEADEFICVDPIAKTTLRPFIDKLDMDVVDIPYCNIVHDVLHNEPSLDISKPILSQRSLWVQIPGKALISRIPQTFSPGFYLSNPPGGVHPMLRIIHARWADRDIMIRRIMSRTGIDNKDSHNLGWNNRDRCTEHHVKDMIDILGGKTFFFRVDMKMCPLPTPIPIEWKKLPL